MPIQSIALGTRGNGKPCHCVRHIVDTSVVFVPPRQVFYRLFSLCNLEHLAFRWYRP